MLAEIDPTLARVDVLGVPVTPCSVTEAVDCIAEWVRAEHRSFATFTGVHGVMEAQRNPEVMRAHQQAGMVACDGAPIVWSSRWAGVTIRERVTGRDFMAACCARAEVEGWSVFLYGGKPGVAEQVSEILRTRYPRLSIVGTYTPPFGPLTKRADDKAVKAINDSGAKLVWVGLSTPKQEIWMADHRARLDATALFGVGAAFDYMTGELAEAPHWMQRTGLEWLFRLLQEPRRLARRYLRNNPAFVRAIIFRRPRIMTSRPRIATKETM